ncbi:hypothetical protein T5B8_13258 [Salinisphaera sp. T5B8]|uniref:hypothetical protein n=1 Tax=Salinisphaera sp. T5B8 TaxID=1304154 RepID=UPI0033429921
MITAIEHHPDALCAFLGAMAQKYFPADRLGDTELAERIAARVMSAGTYRDVCELVDLAGRDYLAWVFSTAPREWFSDPAREYWQRHLSSSGRYPARTRAASTLARTTGHTNALTARVAKH